MSHRQRYSLVALCLVAFYHLPTISAGFGAPLRGQQADSHDKSRRLQFGRGSRQRAGGLRGGEGSKLTMDSRPVMKTPLPAPTESPAPSASPTGIIAPLAGEQCSFQDPGGLVVVCQNSVGIPCNELSLMGTGVVCSLGRPTELLFKVNSGSCAQSTTIQEQATFSCNDASANPFMDGEIVFVNMTGLRSGDVYASEAIQVGENILVSNNGNTLDPDVTVALYRGTSSAGELVQEMQFHVSCSRPITLEEKFGPLSYWPSKMVLKLPASLRRCHSNTPLRSLHHQIQSIFRV